MPVTNEEQLADLHPHFDWRAVARLILTSRKIDELQENILAPSGLVTYQFSAKGHELGQVLMSQLLDRPFDAVSGYYRSRPLMLGVGLTPEEVFASDMARIGGLSGGRDVGVVFNKQAGSSPTVIPMGGDVGSQYTPAAGWAFDHWAGTGFDTSATDPQTTFNVTGDTIGA